MTQLSNTQFQLLLIIDYEIIYWGMCFFSLPLLLVMTMMMIMMIMMMTANVMMGMAMANGGYEVTLCPTDAWRDRQLDK